MNQRASFIVVKVFALYFAHQVGTGSYAYSFTSFTIKNQRKKQRYHTLACSKAKK